MFWTTGATLMSESFTTCCAITLLLHPSLCHRGGRFEESLYHFRLTWRSQPSRWKASSGAARCCAGFYSLNEINIETIFVLDEESLAMRETLEQAQNEVHSLKSQKGEAEERLKRLQANIDVQSGLKGQANNTGRRRCGHLQKEWSIDDQPRSNISSKQ